MSAIALDALAHVTDRLPAAIEQLAAERGWRIIFIDTPEGRVRAIALDSIEPDLREQIISAADARGEKIYLRLSAELAAQVVRSARRCIHKSRVVPIDRGRLLSPAAREEGDHA